MSRHDRFIAFAIINARVKLIDFSFCLFCGKRRPYDLFINTGSVGNGDNLFESHVCTNDYARESNDPRDNNCVISSWGTIDDQRMMALITRTFE